MLNMEMITRDHHYRSGRVKRTWYEVDEAGWEHPIKSMILKGGSQ